MSILERVYSIDVQFSGGKSSVKFIIEAEEYEPLFLTKTETNRAPEIEGSLLQLIGYWAQEGVYIDKGESETLTFDEVLSDFGIDWRYSSADDDDVLPTGETASVRFTRIQ